MKQNNIETAREFYAKMHITDRTHFDIPDFMVAYHNYLNSDSEGTKSAEEILDIFDLFKINGPDVYGDCVFYSDAIRAMKTFSAQSRPELTDEEIHFAAKINEGVYITDTERVYAFERGAKWARTKLTGG